MREPPYSWRRNKVMKSRRTHKMQTRKARKRQFALNNCCSAPPRRDLKFASNFNAKQTDARSSSSSSSQVAVIVTSGIVLRRMRRRRRRRLEAAAAVVVVPRPESRVCDKIVANCRTTRTATIMSTFLLALNLLSFASQAIKMAAASTTWTDFDGATFYKAPVGSRIRIACNASHWNDDSISLVLWFKGNPTAGGANLQPIYTIDARQKALSSGQARHLIADSFKGRAKFVIPAQRAPQQSSTLSTNQTSNLNSNQQQQPSLSSPQVPYLDLAPIEASDQAEYRCRVDYRSRPRENFLIILFVLVPPSSVQIVDTSGRSLEQIYGPLNEGSDLTLLCLAKGGRPSPAITWKSNGRVIDESYLTLNDFLALQLAGASGQLPNPTQARTVRASEHGQGHGHGRGHENELENELEHERELEQGSAAPATASGGGGACDDDKKRNANPDNNRRPHLEQRQPEQQGRQQTIGMWADSINSQWAHDWLAQNRKSSGQLQVPFKQRVELASNHGQTANPSLNSTLMAASSPGGGGTSSLPVLVPVETISSSQETAAGAAWAAPQGTSADSQLDLSRLHSHSNLVKRQASTAAGAAASVPLLDAGEWIAWPEFSYFQLGPSEFFYRNSNNARRQSPAAGNEAGARRGKPLGLASLEPPTGRQANGVNNNNNNNGDELPAQLIDWQVDETITTGVNVLHVSELSRAHLMQLSEHDNNNNSGASASANVNEDLVQQARQRFIAASGPQLQPGLQPQTVLPKLECHASNLHYDLRSLIKMFAPPSLQASRGNLSAAAVASQQHQMRAPQTPTLAAGHDDQLAGSAPRQLTRAIERALLSNLKFLNSQPGGDGGGGDNNNNNDDDDTASQAHLLAAQKQIRHGSIEQVAESKRVQNGTAAEAAPAAAAAAPAHADSVQVGASDANWQALIYQQLIRPHQLVSAAASSGADLLPVPFGDKAQAIGGGAAGKTTTTIAGQQRQSELARNKLIALEAFLRPLDVKIVGPQRPLVAGQVGEFTCTSWGSQPAARLSWFKNGQRLSSASSPPGQVKQSVSSIKQQQVGHFGDSSSGLSAERHVIIETIELAGGGVGGGDKRAFASFNLTSRSKLSIRLGREDHRAELSCRAENVEHLQLVNSSHRHLHNGAPSPSSSSPSSTGTNQDNETTTEASVNATEQVNNVDDASQLRSIQAEDSSSSWVLEDSITLDVHYTPRVRLELGNKMLSEHIREGQDIYFVCLIDSQPAVQEITWLHNERPINETASSTARQQQLTRIAAAAAAANQAGRRDSFDRLQQQQQQQPAQLVGRSVGGSTAYNVFKNSNNGPVSVGGGGGAGNLIVSNNSLVLQRVQIEQGGKYACMATNSEGIGLSNQIELRVLHAPICVPLAQLTDHNNRKRSDTNDEEAASNSFEYQQHLATGAPRAYKQRQQLRFKQMVGATAIEPNGRLDRSLMAEAGAAAGVLAATTSMRLDDNSGQQLHLGSLAVPLNGRSRLKCAMLSEPAGQVEFVWYLNNSFNERRVLFTSTASSSAAASISLTSNDDNDNLIDAPERAQFSSRRGSRHNWQRWHDNNSSSGQDQSQDSELELDRDKWRRLQAPLVGDSGANHDHDATRPSRHLDRSVTEAGAAGAAAAADHNGAAQVAVSQLELNIETQSDYGQLFCVAKNSIGDQKRACVYTIEPPAPSDEQGAQPVVPSYDNNSNNYNYSNNNNNDELALFEGDDKLTPACLAVNVTSRTAWIGCDLRMARNGGAELDQVGGATAAQLDGTNENGQRSSSNNYGRQASGQFKFNVRVFSLSAINRSGTVDEQNGEADNAVASSNNLLASAGQQQQNNNNNNNHFQRQLEANLTSSGLDEPLFALVNLRPSTSYLLEIAALDQQVATPNGGGGGGGVSLVRLTTRAQNSAYSDPLQSLETHQQQQQQQRDLLASSGRGDVRNEQHLAIRQVTEPHRSDLVAAALISTRSASSANLHQHHSEAGLAPAPASIGFASSGRLSQKGAGGDQSSGFWPSLAAMVKRLLGGGPGPGGAGHSNQLTSLATGAEIPRSRHTGVLVAHVSKPSGSAANQYYRAVPPSSSSRASGSGNGSARESSAGARLIKWLHLESDGLLAILVCFSILIITLIGLAALHRFVWQTGGSATRRSQTNSSSSRTKSSKSSDNNNDVDDDDQDQDEDDNYGDAEEIGMKISGGRGIGASGDMHLVAAAAAATRFSGPNEPESKRWTRDKGKVDDADDSTHAKGQSALNFLRSSVCLAPAKPLLGASCLDYENDHDDDDDDDDDGDGKIATSKQAAAAASLDMHQDVYVSMPGCGRQAAATGSNSTNSSTASGRTQQATAATTRHYLTLNSRQQHHSNQVTDFLQPSAIRSIEAQAAAATADHSTTRLLASSTASISAYNQAYQIYASNNHDNNNNSNLASSETVVVPSGRRRHSRALGNLNNEPLASSDAPPLLPLSQMQSVTRSRSSMCLGSGEGGGGSLQQHELGPAALNVRNRSGGGKKKCKLQPPRLVHSSGCAANKQPGVSSCAIKRQQQQRDEENEKEEEEEEHKRLISDANALFLNSDSSDNSKQKQYYHNSRVGEATSSGHRLLYNQDDNRQFLATCVSPSTTPNSQQHQHQLEQQQQQQQPSTWHYIEVANGMSVAAAAADNLYATTTCNCDNETNGNCNRLAALVLSQEMVSSSNNNNNNNSICGQLSSSMISDSLSDSNALQISATSDNLNWPQIGRQCNGGQQVNFIEILPMIQDVGGNSAMDATFKLTTSGADNNMDDYLAQQHNQHKILMEPVQVAGQKAQALSNLSINMSNTNQSFTSSSLGSTPPPPPLMSQLVKDSLVSSPMSFTTNTTPSNTESYQNNIHQVSHNNASICAPTIVAHSELMVDNGNQSDGFNSSSGLANEQPDGARSKAAYRSILKKNPDKSNNSRNNHESDETQAYNICNCNNDYDDSLTNL